MTERELVARARAGDQEAFEQLVLDNQNRIYTLTYGDRSTKEPEYEAPLPGQDDAEQQNREAAKTGDILLYVGIGVFAGAIVAAVAAVISKKKKAAKAQQK